MKKISEADVKSIIQISFIKKATGGGTITIRDLENIMDCTAKKL